MANQPPKQLWTYLGFVLWGDISDLTMYRRYDGRLVVFQKTWPDKPPCQAQLDQRAAFKAASLAWRSHPRPNAQSGRSPADERPLAARATISGCAGK